jgi:hypothetical protein
MSLTDVEILEIGIWEVFREFFYFDKVPYFEVKERQGILFIDVGDKNFNGFRCSYSVTIAELREAIDKDAVAELIGKKLLRQIIWFVLDSFGTLPTSRIDVIHFNKYNRG